ncbi:hypothetical protein [Nocardia rhamnosiphila]|uniref:hypothetical protein n=1 Tax=Nocardia rhamnosiphila TaxID=426716 RepID=UPI0004C30F02|nr:hypothetical protein [Nocardia rhamnosiphila]
MLIKKTAVLAAGVAAALGITAAAADATPNPADGLGISAVTIGQSAVITVESGSLVQQGNVLEVRSEDGTVLAGTDLSFRLDDFVLPITAQIHDRTVTLTPHLDPRQAVYRPSALPVADPGPWSSAYEREQAAWGRLTSSIGMGAMLGAMAGTIGGAAVGCLLGGLTGATIAAAAIVGMFGPFLPAAALGCLGGIAAIGPLGAVAGQLFVTAPITVAAAIQYFITINEPFGSPTT